MSERRRGVLLVVIGGVFVLVCAALLVWADGPLISVVGLLFGLGILFAGVAMLRRGSDAGPGVMWAMMAGALLMGIALLIVVVSMIDPTSPLWEARRPWSLFVGSLIGAPFFLGGGIFAAYILLGQLRSQRE